MRPPTTYYFPIEDDGSKGTGIRVIEKKHFLPNWSISLGTKCFLHSLRAPVFELWPGIKRPRLFLDQSQYLLHSASQLWVHSFCQLGRIVPHLYVWFYAIPFSEPFS